MSRETVEELQKGQKLLKEEVSQLKAQMKIIQILLGKEDNPSPYQSQACPAPQIPQP
ncbi:hypothetical protein A2U01_0089954, partial [Trifolium medium]|nr:hypothetical protein [Trifolium medium]